MDENLSNELREILLDEEKFKNLSKAFIEKAVEEDQKEDAEFAKWHSMALEAVTTINTKYVFDLCESPIEKIFMNSLLLGFLKADSLGLIIHPTYQDTDEELTEFRTYFRNFLSFLEWYDNKFDSWTGIEDYLDGEVKAGKMEGTERDFLRQLTFRYHYLRMTSSYHLTLQAKFPGIIIDGKSIRPDLYFWLPSDKNVKVIVECDGFEHHSNKDSFVSDRKRDRVLQSKGFQVLRFSGSEIYNESVTVTSNILEFLWGIKPNSP
jgi:hypothetical protein